MHYQEVGYPSYKLPKEISFEVRKIGQVFVYILFTFVARHFLWLAHHNNNTTGTTCINHILSFFLSV